MTRRTGFTRVVCTYGIHVGWAGMKGEEEKKGRKGEKSPARGGGVSPCAPLAEPSQEISVVRSQWAIIREAS